MHDMTWREAEDCHNAGDEHLLPRLVVRYMLLVDYGVARKDTSGVETDTLRHLLRELRCTPHERRRSVAAEFLAEAGHDERAGHYAELLGMKRLTLRHTAIDLGGTRSGTSTLTPEFLVLLILTMERVYPEGKTMEDLDDRQRRMVRATVEEVTQALYYVSNLQQKLAE